MSYGFDPEPSLCAAPALWFRFDLGNVVQGIPSASISSPAFLRAHPQSQDCATTLQSTEISNVKRLGEWLGLLLACSLYH